MSLQHLKVNPFRLSAEVNAVWNPPYPRTNGEGFVIATIKSAKEEECPSDRLYAECGWKHFVGELVEDIYLAWDSRVGRFEPEFGVELYFNPDPNYIHNFAVLTKELRPIICMFNAPEGPKSLDKEPEIYRRLVTALGPEEQLRRIELRLLLSRGELLLVKGFLDDFNSRKEDQDRETCFDGCREGQLEELKIEISWCKKMREILKEIEAENAQVSERLATRVPKDKPADVN